MREEKRCCKYTCW